MGIGGTFLIQHQAISSPPLYVCLNFNIPHESWQVVRGTVEKLLVLNFGLNFVL